MHMLWRNGWQRCRRRAGACVATRDSGELAAPGWSDRDQDSAEEGEGGRFGGCGEGDADEVGKGLGGVGLGVGVAQGEVVGHEGQVVGVDIVVLVEVGQAPISRANGGIEVGGEDDQVE